MKPGDACPKCGAAVRACSVGDPDVHCDGCDSVFPVWDARPAGVPRKKPAVNVRAIIAAALRAHACEVELTTNGHIRVVCPDGAVWTFTIPKPQKPEKA